MFPELSDAHRLTLTHCHHSQVNKRWVQSQEWYQTKVQTLCRMNLIQMQFKIRICQFSHNCNSDCVYQPDLPDVLQASQQLGTSSPEQTLTTGQSRRAR